MSDRQRSRFQSADVAALVGAMLAMLVLTGCVGPMACGPGGCGSGGCGSGACNVGGPIVLNRPCGGCDDDGCGELYIDPWINHPADACDPCDRCGNYNGQSCGKCRSVFGGVASLWGYRCGNDTTCGDGCGCGGGGCSSCGVQAGCGVEASCGLEPACGIESCSGCATCGGGMESFHSSGSHAIGTPTPAPSMDDVRVVPQAHEAERPYTPQRTRQIFRNRQQH